MMAKNQELTLVKDTVSFAIAIPVAVIAIIMTVVEIFDKRKRGYL